MDGQPLPRRADRWTDSPCLAVQTASQAQGARKEPHASTISHTPDHGGTELPFLAIGYRSERRAASNGPLVRSALAKPGPQKAKHPNSAAQTAWSRPPRPSLASLRLHCRVLFGTVRTFFSIIYSFPS
ncbi:unnamed protein product [Caretta caretta]